MSIPSLLNRVPLLSVLGNVSRVIVGGSMSIRKRFSVVLKFFVGGYNSVCPDEVDTGNNGIGWFTHTIIGNPMRK